MQGNRTSEQQGKICLTHGARASTPNQALTAQPGTRARPRPQPDRLPKPYIPIDEVLLPRVVQQPLLTFAELLLQLWPSLPYRAFPRLDSASETRRRGPAPGNGAPHLLQTSARWLRAQLRRQPQAVRSKRQHDPDGVCYLPAGLTLLHRPAPIRFLDHLTREEGDLYPTTGCIIAPDAPRIPAPGRRTSEPFTLLPATAATRPEQARLARVATVLHAGRGPFVDLASRPTTALTTVLTFSASAKEHHDAARLEVGHA